MKKLNSKRTENLILYVLGGLLIIFFAVNITLLYKDNSTHNSGSISPAILESVALSYLKGNKEEKAGYLLDCSGFTRSVYRQCNMNIPGSAKEQFAACKRLEAIELTKGNLVFFSINSHEISHTGIYLDSSRFIHSPGKMRYVRIDTLSNPYWESCFVCGGMPNFNASITLY